MTARNDLAQYDTLVDAWERPDGPFAALHWLADARAALIPPPQRPGAVLVDLGCGGGLMAGRLDAGWRHIGVDRTASALAVAARRGVEVVRADVTAVPLPDAVADVVLAGEILEHVADLEGAVAEACRLLRPGGTLVLDTIAASAFARVWYVHIGERVPGGPPRGIHDPALFVDPERLRAACRRHGVVLGLRGLWAPLWQVAAFNARWRRAVTMVPIRSLAGVIQGLGRKVRA